MKRKELSKASASDEGNFTLPKSTILRGKRNLQNLFTDSTVLSKGSLNLRFAISDAQPTSYKVGFISPKRTGNAVRRNRMKRLMRESFRLQKAQFSETIHCIDRELHLAFIGRTTKADYDQVFRDMATLLSDLRSRICSNTE